MKSDLLNTFENIFDYFLIIRILFYLSILLFFGISCTSPSGKIEKLSMKDRFITVSSNIVQDRLTGLFWNSRDIRHANNFELAKNFCQDVIIDELSDWRLPHIKELNSLVLSNRKDPAAPDILNMEATRYWSSTTYADTDSFAWIIDFSDGRIHIDRKNVLEYFRCVRGGQ